jgi:hypothetical protein
LVAIPLSRGLVFLLLLLFLLLPIEEDLVQHTVPLDGVQYDVSILEIGSSASAKKVFPKVHNTTQHDTTRHTPHNTAQHDTARHNTTKSNSAQRRTNQTELGHEKGQAPWTKRTFCSSSTAQHGALFLPQRWLGGGKGKTSPPKRKKKVGCVNRREQWPRTADLPHTHARTPGRCSN